ncbi:MAG: YbhB/YbcL family Raf kinase inhibitor-like protein [Nitrososphaera sp.]
MKTTLLLVLGLVMLIVSQTAYADHIPSWIKNNAKWWSQNQISDDDFVKGIQFLIDNNIIKVTGQSVSSNSHIPSWIKKTAGWWSDGSIGDSVFIQGIQYLIQIQVIKITQGTFALTSPAFENNGTIPVEYTCDGDNTSPPLVISGMPQNTTSLALVMDDPDATHGTFVHWTMFNISPEKTQFTKGDVSSPQGLNGINKQGYFGPCPPSGNHHYFFKLYALDTNLNFPSPPTKSDLEQAMTGHILAKATLLGRYSRG